MNRAETIQRIADDLLSVGVQSSEVLLVHSSLSSMGYIPGDAETVIQGLLTALGPKGTLLMPALSSKDASVFDVVRSPTWTGTIPETFHTRPGTSRSIHPTHSVCGFGRVADKILQEHYMDSTPCGAHSPFRLLRDFHGKILMLGCGLKPNTSFHAIEETVSPPYLFGPTRTFKLVLADGRVQEKSYRMHGFVGWRQRYDRIEVLLSKKDLRQGRVLAAKVYLLDVPAMWEAALSALRRDPCHFVEKKPN